MDKKPLIGWGSQADRKLVGENISNLPLYVLLCGEVNALIPLIWLAISLPNNILKKFFNKTSFLSEEKFSIIVIFYLAFRSMTKNSFCVFSMDCLVALLAIATICEDNANNSPDDKFPVQNEQIDI